MMLSRKDGAKNPSPPKQANPTPFRASPGPNASPIRSYSASFGHSSPPLESLPEDNQGTSPSANTTGLVGLLQSPEVP